MREMQWNVKVGKTKCSQVAWLVKTSLACQWACCALIKYLSMHYEVKYHEFNCTMVNALKTINVLDSL